MLAFEDILQQFGFNIFLKILIWIQISYFVTFSQKFKIVAAEVSYLTFF